MGANEIEQRETSGLPPLRPLYFSVDGKEVELWSRFSAEETLKILGGVDAVYSDLDGTALLAGATQFSGSTAEVLSDLQSAEVGVTFVTGKPGKEITALFDSTSSEIPLRVLVEKGAFTMKREEDSAKFEQKPLLFGGEVEKVSRELKEREEELHSFISQRCGVDIVPAGSGAHEVVVSMDVVGKGETNLAVENRGKVKLKVRDKWEAVFQAVQDWVQENFPEAGMCVANLGNGNIEVFHEDLDKVKGVLRLREEAGGNEKRSLVIGDSGNDLSMLQMGGDPGDNIYAAVVVHGHTPHKLIEASHFAVRGEAAAEDIFRFIAFQKRVNTDIAIIRDGVTRGGAGILWAGTQGKVGF